MKINTIYNEDALKGLIKLEDNSIDCIITSPPYYQLRDYGHDGQIGLENTVKEYIDKLSAIFKECQRVLKEDGTMWINISDTYNGNKKGKTDEKYQYMANDQNINKKQIKSIQRKSLLGVPARLQISLIDMGWILRNEIIWYKPNAMPSSVKDRFTTDFEIIFFLTKSQKYYFNQLKESMKTTDTSQPRGSKGVVGQLNGGLRKQDKLGKETYTGFNDIYTPPEDLMRNMRTVWTIPTQASEIEHFAMFPEELVERCIESGCKPKGIVLDMFSGSGTTCKVAKKLDRDYIGFEINPKYVELSNKRIKNQVRQVRLEL